MNINTQCYVYKWTHLPTLNWYVGSRTAKNAHPNDGYICSSRIVKPLIEANSNDWVREIIAVGPSDEMYELETEILRLFDAKNDPRSFNRGNNELPRGATFGMLGKTQSTNQKQIVAARVSSYRSRPEIKQRYSDRVSGDKNPMFGKTGTNNHFFGKTHSDETKKHLSELASQRTGWSHTDETKSKMSKSNSAAAKNRPFLTCQYCEKIIQGNSNMVQHIRARHKDEQDRP